MTTINNVSQIEHLMSALYALKINSLLIYIDKNELPILMVVQESILIKLMK